MFLRKKQIGLSQRIGSQRVARNRCRTECLQSGHTTIDPMVEHPHTSDFCLVERTLPIKARQDTYTCQAPGALSDLKLHRQCSVVVIRKLAAQKMLAGENCG